jgi:hypothetical protein
VLNQAEQIFPKITVASFLLAGQSNQPELPDCSWYDKPKLGKIYQHGHKNTK